MIKINKSTKAIVLLLIGSLFGSGSTFVIYIILARELGPETFGLFGSMLSLANIFTILASFGIAQIWLKIFGQEGWQGVRWIIPSVKFLFMVTVGVISLLICWSYFGPHTVLETKVLFILIFFILGRVMIELITSVLQLEERYGKLSILQILPNLFRLTLILWLVYFMSQEVNIVNISLIYAFVGIVFILFGGYKLFKVIKGDFSLKGHGNKKIDEFGFPKVLDIYKEAVPFVMASTFAFIYVQSDIIMVKYMSGDIQAGYYNVSFIVTTAILIFPSILYQKFLLPKYHRWSHNNRKLFFQVYKKGNRLMLLFGFFIMIIILFLSSWSIPFIFGKDYVNAVVLVNILAVTVPIYFLSYSIGATLVTKNYMKLKVKLMGAIAIVNIMLNLLLIPEFDALGASIATLISNILLLLLYYRTAENKIFKKEKNYVEKY